MKKLLFVAIILISVSIHAQESHLQNPLKFQVGFFNYKGIYSYWGPVVNLNYSITKHFELGGSVAYNSFAEKYPNGFTNHIQRLYYAFDAYYHLSPYFIKADDIKFDLYLKGLLGAESVISSDIDYSKLTYFNYGAFVGAAYYPWSKLGFYGEFGLGNKATDSKIRSLAHFGLSYRFGK